MILLIMTGIKSVTDCHQLRIAARAIDSIIREQLPLRKQINRYHMFIAQRLEKIIQPFESCNNMRIKPRIR